VSPQLFNGYVELVDGSGVKTVDIHQEQPEGYINAWVDGNLADDVETRDEFARSYGDKLFDSLEGYKNDEIIDLEEVWPE
jgi:hypothetical protein